MVVNKLLLKMVCHQRINHSFLFLKKMEVEEARAKAKAKCKEGKWIKLEDSKDLLQAAIKREVVTQQVVNKDHQMPQVKVAKQLANQGLITYHREAPLLGEMPSNQRVISLKARSTILMIKAASRERCTYPQRTLRMHQLHHWYCYYQVLKLHSIAASANTCALTPFTSYQQ